MGSAPEALLTLWLLSEAQHSVRTGKNEEVDLSALTGKMSKIYCTRKRLVAYHKSSVVPLL